MGEGRRGLGRCGWSVAASGGRRSAPAAPRGPRLGPCPSLSLSLSLPVVSAAVSRELFSVWRCAVSLRVRGASRCSKPGSARRALLPAARCPPSQRALVPRGRLYPSPPSRGDDGPAARPSGTRARGWWGEELVTGRRGAGLAAFARVGALTRSASLPPEWGQSPVDRVLPWSLSRGRPFLRFFRVHRQVVWRVGFLIGGWRLALLSEDRCETRMRECQRCFIACFFFFLSFQKCSFGATVWVYLNANPHTFTSKTKNLD